MFADISSKLLLMTCSSRQIPVLSDTPPEDRTHLGVQSRGGEESEPIACSQCEVSINTKVGSEWARCSQCVQLNLCLKCAVSHPHRLEVRVFVQQGLPRCSQCQWCGNDASKVKILCGQCLVEMCETCYLDGFHSLHADSCVIAVNQVRTSGPSVSGNFYVFYCNMLN